MMKRTTLAAATEFGLAAFRSVAAPVPYIFDTVRSRVPYDVNPFGFPDSVGQFKVGAGAFPFDDDDWSNSKTEARHPAQSLERGDPEWNAEILNAGSLEAAQYRAIDFVRTKVEKLAGGNARRCGGLTIADVTMPVGLDLSLDKDGEHPTRETPTAGFTATTAIQRPEFGITTKLPIVSGDLESRSGIGAFDSPGA